MSFPSFLNIWPAILAASLAIPLLLVLYFLKLRRRELPVSSTLLWKKAIVDLQVNAPFQKLRRNLLLILQMLLLLALLLALSRPVVTYSKAAGRSTVILIDRSASMGARDGLEGKGTRLEEAKQRAKSLVDTLDRHSQAMVIAFDDSAETVQPFTSDTIALKNAIDTIKQTDRRSKLKLAYQLAEAQTNFNPEQLRSNAIRPDVRVFSDGRVLDASELAIRGDVTFEKIGSDKSGNIAVVALSSRRNYERPTEVQIFARLANFGPEPVTADVQLSIDGAVKSIATTNLFPDRWDQKRRDEEESRGAVAKEGVEFTIDLPTSAVVKVEQMNKSGDVLASDDFAQIVVPPAKNLQLALVTDGNDPYLVHLVNSLNVQQPTIMSSADWNSKKPTNFDVVIFDNVKPQFLPTAGNFIDFGFVPDNLRIHPHKENGNIVVIPGVTTVLDWERDHPLLRGLPLRKLYMTGAFRLDTSPETEVLVDGAESPLIVLQREGRQIHLITAFDPLNSIWPLQESFPEFMNNALPFLALGTDLALRQSMEPGSTPRIPRTALQQTAPNATSVTLKGPDVNRTIPIPTSGDFALPALDRVGVYTTDPAIPPYDHFAVNLLDANESNIMPAEKAPGGIGEVAATSATKARLELWWWLAACGALPLLMIEWWVYTRRVHL